jgi:hypothetical protein
MKTITFSKPRSLTTTSSVFCVNCAQYESPFNESDLAIGGSPSKKNLATKNDRLLRRGHRSLCGVNRHCAQRKRQASGNS